MNNTIQNIKTSQIDSPRVQQESQLEVATLQIAQITGDSSDPGSEATDLARGTIQRFQPLRFAVGLCCTSSGVALILGVGLRVIAMQEISSDFAMPLIAVCVVTGVMLLGAGFGVMATSSSGFDEAEFDRLATAGNISAVSQTHFDHQNDAIPITGAKESAA